MSLRTKERVLLGDKKMDLKPIIHHRYNGRHVRTRDTERTESVETFQRRKTARLCLGRRGVGRERFRIKARSGVGGVSSSNWIACMPTDDKCFMFFVSSWGYYRIAAGKRKGERKQEGERSPLRRALEHTQVNL